MSQADVNRDRRDAEIARTGSRPVGVGTFFTKVVGVSFVPSYPDNLRALDELSNPKPLPSLPYPMFQGDMAQYYAEKDWEEYEERRSRGPQRHEPLTAILVRNPDNAYDSNAIEVHVPGLGVEMAMIGHLTRPIAARIAPEMDAGTRWAAAVESVLIDPAHMDNPGISIHCMRVREDET